MGSPDGLSFHVDGTGAFARCCGFSVERGDGTGAWAVG